FQPRELADPTTPALRAHLAGLRRAGITVVVPAGDLGPRPQTVLGIAGLPEVITVGALGKDGVAANSSSGPSQYGGVKADLVAPDGIGGLVPEKSALAKTLTALVGSTLPLPPSVGGRRVSMASTVPAAVLVAAQVAQLRVSG